MKVFTRIECEMMIKEMLFKISVLAVWGRGFHNLFNLLWILIILFVEEPPERWLQSTETLFWGSVGFMNFEICLCVGWYLFFFKGHAILFYFLKFLKIEV